jgi:hypothetical protein
MKPFALLFLALFGGASAVNVLSEINEWQWGIYLSKPLLMTFLGLYFFTVTQVKTNFSRRILTGLIFSLAGDTLLMLVSVHLVGVCSLEFESKACLPQKRESRPPDGMTDFCFDLTSTTLSASSTTGH